MNEDLLDVILKTTYTKADLLKRLSIIRSYFEICFFSSRDELSFDAYLDKLGLGESEKQVLIKNEIFFNNLFNKENLYKIFNESDKKIKNLPTITLYIPDNPSDVLIQNLGSWFRTKLQSQVLIDIRGDNNNVGGCSFAKYGKFYDYTLHHFIQKNHDNILNMINQYDTKKD